MGRSKGIPVKRHRHRFEESKVDRNDIENSDDEFQHNQSFFTQEREDVYEHSTEVQICYRCDDDLATENMSVPLQDSKLKNDFFLETNFESLSQLRQYEVGDSEEFSLLGSRLFTFPSHEFDYLQNTSIKLCYYDWHLYVVMHKSNGINLVYKSIFPLLQSIYDKIFERKIIMTINQNSWSSSENGLTVFINIFVSLPVHSKLYIPKTILQEWIFQYDQQSWLSVGEDEPEFDSEQFLKNASSIISTATATVDSTISHKLQDLLRHLGVKTSLRRYQLQGIEWMYDHYNEVYGNSSENDRRITERNNSVSFVLPDGRFILKSNDDHVILAYDLWREELEALRHFTPHSTSCSSNGIILADEMGLGKSLQILCLILLAKQNYGIRVKELNISPVNATGSTAKREDIKGCPCERKEMNIAKDFGWIQCCICNVSFHRRCVGLLCGNKRNDSTKFTCLACSCRYHGSGENQLRCKTALVVLPDTLLSQWQTEIHKHMHARFLHDDIFTHANTTDASDSNAGGHHQKHSSTPIPGSCKKDIPGRRKSRAKTAQSVDAKTTELENHMRSADTPTTIDSKFKVFVYEGVEAMQQQLQRHCKRNQSYNALYPHELAQNDIIFISLRTLRREYHTAKSTYMKNSDDESSHRRRRQSRNRSNEDDEVVDDCVTSATSAPTYYPPPILCLYYHMLIIDETQKIETEGMSNIFSMARYLRSDFRVCVSGTPLGSGKLSDLKSLCGFLRLGVFETSPCKSAIDYESSAEKRICNNHDCIGQDVCEVCLKHKNRQWNAIFGRQSVLSNAGKMLLLLQYFSNRILRRDKFLVQAEINLTPCEFKVNELYLTEFEMALYKERKRELIREINSRMKSLESSTFIVDVSHKLEILRKGCCHPTMLDKGLTRERKALRKSFGIDHNASAPPSFGELIVLKIEQARLQCEEQQRKLLFDLCKVGGISLLQHEVVSNSQAMDVVQETESLNRSMDEYSFDCLLHMSQAITAYFLAWKIFEKNRQLTPLIAVSKLHGSQSLSSIHQPSYFNYVENQFMEYYWILQQPLLVNGTSNKQAVIKENGLKEMKSIEMWSHIPFVHYIFQHGKRLCRIKLRIDFKRFQNFNLISSHDHPCVTFCPKTIRILASTGTHDTFAIVNEFELPLMSSIRDVYEYEGDMQSNGVSFRSKNWKVEVLSVYNRCFILRPDGSSGWSSANDEGFEYDALEDAMKLQSTHVINFHLQFQEATFDVDSFQELHICHNLLDIMTMMVRIRPTLQQLDQSLVDRPKADSSLTITALKPLSGSDVTSSFELIQLVNSSAICKINEAHLRARIEYIQSQFLRTVEIKRLTSLQYLKDKQTDVEDIMEQIVQALQASDIGTHRSKREWWHEAVYLLGRDNSSLCAFTAHIQQYGDAYSRSFPWRFSRNCTRRLTEYHLNRMLSIRDAFKHFRDLSGLLYLIGTEFQKLEESRTKALNAMLSLSSKPSDSDILEASDCRKCRAYFFKTGPICKHCKLEEVLKAYENHLFSFKNVRKSVVSKPVMRSDIYDEDAEVVSADRFDGHFLMLMKHLKSISLKLNYDFEGQIASLEINRVQKMQAEFQAMYGLWDKHSNLLKAHDELGMSKSRLQLRSTQHQIYDKENSLWDYELDSVYFSTFHSCLINEGQLNKSVHHLIFYKNQEMEWRKKTSKDQLQPLQTSDEMNFSCEESFDDCCAICRESYVVSEPSMNELEAPKTGKISSPFTPYTSEKSTKSATSQSLSETVSGDELQSKNCEDNKVTTISVEENDVHFVADDDKCVVLPCMHRFHKYCITVWLRRHHKCALCKHEARVKDICPISTNKRHYSDIDASDLNESRLVSRRTQFDLNNHNARDQEQTTCRDGSRNQQTMFTTNVVIRGEWGTKIDALLRDIIGFLHTKTCDGEKAIVFSQWVEMISLVSSALHFNNIPFACCNGTSRIKDFGPNGALEIFRSSPDVRILLMPLALGAEGLDLVLASRIFLLEPLINKSIEAQAIHRIRRIGQLKPCYIHKYVVMGTVEEKIHNSRNEINTQEGERDNRNDGSAFLAPVSARSLRRRGVNVDVENFSTQQILEIMND